MMMKRLTNLFICCAIVTGALSGCAGFRRAERPAWRNEAELACLKTGTVKESAYVKRVNPIEGPGICGANYPLKVAAIQADVTGSVPNAKSAALTDITPPAVFACPMVSAMERYMEQIVQPAAYARFGEGVLEVKTFGSYNCRARNHQSGAPLSEHSFANAVDIAAFVLGSGRVVTIERGWKGAEDERGFLREVHMGACGVFTTVLGPGSNALHYNHFHLDMARHNSRGGAYCRPIVDVPPRVDPYQAQLQAQVQSPGQIRTIPSQSPVNSSTRPVFKPDPGFDETPDIQEDEQFDAKKYDLTSSISRRRIRALPLPQKLDQTYDPMHTSK